MSASYGGSAIFGRSVAITHVPNPSAVQYSTFFGTGGVYSLYGGSRGRTFAVRGCLYGTDFPSLQAAVDRFQSYDDGIARTLVDTIGVAWPQVVYKAFEPAGPYQYGHGGVLLPYRALFEGRL